MEGNLLESEEDALFKQFLLQVTEYKLEYLKRTHSRY